MRFGIRLKAFVAIILTSAFVGFIVGTPLVNRSITILTNHELVDLKDETLLRGRELVSCLQTHRNDALGLSHMPEMRELLTAWTESEMGKSELRARELAPKVRALLQSRFATFADRNLFPKPRYVEARLVARDGTILSQYQPRSVPAGSFQKINDIEEFRKLFRLDQTVIVRGVGAGGPTFSSHPSVMNAIVVIWGKSRSEPLGVFMLYLDFGELRKEIERSNRHLVFLVNEKDEIILHPSQEKDGFEKEPFHSEYKQFFEKELTNLKDGVIVSDFPMKKYTSYVMEMSIDQSEAEHLEAKFRSLADMKKFRQLRFPTGINMVPKKPSTLITGQDIDALKEARDLLRKEFGGKIDVRRPTKSERFALQMIRLPYDFENTNSRYFGMVMAFAHEEIERALWDGVYTTVLIGALVSGFVAALMGMFTLFLTKPLSNIIRATEDIAQGKVVTSRLAVNRTDEIGDLARSFQMMIDKIHEREGELRLLNRALDQRVRDRTAMLEVAIKDLEKARDKAFEAVKARDAFLATVSHELRTPLNHIGGYCQLLEITDLDDEQREDLQKVRKAADHLLAIINDILDYQKIIMGVIPIHPESFDAKKLISEVSESMRGKVSERKNRLIVQCADDVGQIESDPKRLRQVLLNLIGNACKFTSDGDIGVKADRIEKDGRPLIRIRIADTGIGMKSDHLKKLFKPFSKVSDKSQNPEGTGLGLVISQGLARRMGGDITVQSEPGRGTVFTITIAENCSEEPSKKAGFIKGDSVYLPARSVKTPTSVQGTVLAVDDDPDATEVLKRFLEPEGYEVVVASDGNVGLHLAKQIKPSLITLDVIMPGRDGWQVLAALKADPETADIPVILVTMMEDERQAIRLGATEFVTKPIDRERIIDLVKRHTHVMPARILVVDDDTQILDISTRILSEAGHQVVTAQNGQEALQRLQEHRIDLVLLDLIMPVMDGFAFLMEFRKRDAWSEIPIIVITAKDLDDDENAFLQEAVVRILKKSDFKQPNVLEEVHRLLHGNGSSGKESSL